MKNTVIRFAAGLLCVIMVLGMAACTQSPAPTAAPTTAASVAPVSQAPASEAPASEAPATQAPSTALLDGAAAPPQDPFGKFDPPIEVTLVHTSNDGAFWFPAGDDINKNIYTRTYEEKLGIKYKFLWTCPGSQAEEKINVMMASGDIPDMLSVSRTNFEKLYSAGKLADLTSATQNYASLYTKKYLTGEYSSLLDAATKDGKIYGLTRGFSYKDSANMIWIRADWLKKLNMEAPKSLAELETIMDAFVKNDPDGNGKTDTYALGVAGAGISGNSYNFGLNVSFFNMFHAYPNEWVKNTAGDLEDGMFGPNFRSGAKAALVKLKDWYAKGYLNPDFATYDDAKFQEDMTSDKFGVVFSDLWGSWWPLLLCLDKNPKADWVPVAIPSADDKPVFTNNTAGIVDGINVVSASFAHPEALVKMCNLYHDLNNNPETTQDFDKYNTDPKDNNQIFLCYPLTIYNPSFNYDGYKAISAAMQAGSDANLPPAYKIFYNQALAYKTSGDKSGWPSYRCYTDVGCFGVIDGYIANKQYMLNEYTAEPTAFMIENWASVKKIYDLTFLSIVMGGDEAQFDAYIAQYDSLYGTQAAKEVNDWFSTNGKKSVQDWFNALK